MSLTGDKAASIPGLQSCGSVGRSCPTFEQAPLFLGPLEAPHVPSPITAKPEEPGGEGGGWKGKRRGRFHRETSPPSCRAPRAGMPAALPHWKRTTLSHPALRVLLPALRPYGDSHKQGPEPRPGAEGAARRSSAIHLYCKVPGAEGCAVAQYPQLTHQCGQCLQRSSAGGISLPTPSGTSPSSSVHCTFFLATSL